MTAALLLAALLTVSDPVGDASGDGNLRYPTDVVFRTPGALDVERFEVLDSETFVFRITMGGLPNPWELPNGFSLPILEIYLDLEETLEEPGAQELLPGSGMRLPAGRSWSHALRIHGDAAEAFEGRADGSAVPLGGALDVRVVTEGNAILVHTALPRPSRFGVYAMAGGYDPFTDSGWRPVRPDPSPWAFSSETQVVPVVDVIADSVDAQVQAIQTGVLPEIRQAPAASMNPWLLLAGAGVLLGVGGFALRFFVRPLPYDAPAEVPEAESPPARVPDLPRPALGPSAPERNALEAPRRSSVELEHPSRRSVMAALSESGRFPDRALPPARPPLGEGPFDTLHAGDVPVIVLAAATGLRAAPRSFLLPCPAGQAGARARRTGGARSYDAGDALPAAGTGAPTPEATAAVRVQGPDRRQSVDAGERQAAASDDDPLDVDWIALEGNDRVDGRGVGREGTRGGALPPRGERSEPERDRRAETGIGVDDPPVGDEPGFDFGSLDEHDEEAASDWDVWDDAGEDTRRNGERRGR